MKKLRKTMAVIGMAAVMAVSAVVPAFAGSWQNIGGLWYFADPEDNGSDDFLTGWQWIDGYCYYLDPNAGGAMAVLTITPDGFFVDAEGHWINEFGVPYFMDGFGYSTSTGPIAVGMDYTDPALSGPAFADVPEEVRYPGDDVIVSGATQNSSPHYGALYGGISVQTILDIRNAIRQMQAIEEGLAEAEAEEWAELPLERPVRVGGNSEKSEEKYEATEKKSEVTEEKSAEAEEKSSETKESEETKEKDEEAKEPEESGESTEKTESSKETEKETNSEKETKSEEKTSGKSEEKTSDNKDTQSKEDSEDD